MNRNVIPITNAEINLDKEFSLKQLRKWIEKWSNDRKLDVWALEKREYKFQVFNNHFQKLIQIFFLWSWINIQENIQLKKKKKKWMGILIFQKQRQKDVFKQQSKV